MFGSLEVFSTGFIKYFKPESTLEMSITLKGRHVSHIDRIVRSSQLMQSIIGPIKDDSSTIESLLESIVLDLLIPLVLSNGNDVE